jgi:hypothetical protein
MITAFAINVRIFTVENGVVSQLPLAGMAAGTLFVVEPIFAWHCLGAKDCSIASWAVLFGVL